MFDLERFLNFARDRVATDEALPCQVDDFACVMSYLTALVPEYQLAYQDEMTDGEARRADRRRAALDGFRRARGEAPLPTSDDDEDTEDRSANPGRGNGSSRRPPSPPEAA